jgi:hypothetical protein
VRVSQTTLEGFPHIAFRTGSLHQSNGSLGFKVNPIGKLLITFNTLFRLNDAGLRGRVTPLLGASYTF